MIGLSDGKSETAQRVIADPTNTFTLLKTQSLSIGVSKVHKVQQSLDFDFSL